MGNERLTVYVLQSAFTIPLQGMGDAAVLYDKATKAHLMFYGETMKHWLNRGLAGFRLPFKKDPVDEAKDIVTLWKDYFEELCARHGATSETAGNESFYKIREEICLNMKPLGTDLRRIVDRFINPALFTAYDYPAIRLESVSDEILRYPLANSASKEKARGVVTRFCQTLTAIQAAKTPSP
ncbi:MAG: hypothetical protein WC612_03060 [Bdellovibrionales bacterium]